jgi:hypothetical protein
MAMREVIVATRPNAIAMKESMDTGRILAAVDDKSQSGSNGAEERTHNVK